jgi:hypothetical protein
LYVPDLYEVRYSEKIPTGEDVGAARPSAKLITLLRQTTAALPINNLHLVLVLLLTDDVDASPRLSINFIRCG